VREPRWWRVSLISAEAATLSCCVGVAIWSLPQSAGTEKFVWCCIAKSRKCFSASDSDPLSKWTPVLRDLEGDIQYSTALGTAHQVCPGCDNCKLKNSLQTLALVGVNRSVPHIEVRSGVEGCIVLERATCLQAIQVTTLLDMTGVCRNDCIGHTEEPLCSDPRHLEAVEVLLLYFR
jgi:hypothetical protein